MDHEKRSVEHYRDYQLISVVDSQPDGWVYTVHVVEHQGDTDHLRCEESSAEHYGSDIEALHAARQRGHELVDALAASTS